MMERGGYGQFCPVAMAAEILCRRWTIVILRELLAGSTRFSELRKGAPRMSPALLSLRLKELEAAGVIARGADEAAGEYHLTESGRELRPIVEGFGVWGQRWVETQPSLQNLDVQLLMWDMRRNIDPAPLPHARRVVQFVYPELPAKKRSYWLVIDPQLGVDLCCIDMGFDVDLYVSTDLRSMTAIWMGLDTVRAATGSGRMMLTGDRDLADAMQSWLGLSPFAVERKLAS